MRDNFLVDCKRLFCALIRKRKHFHLELFAGIGIRIDLIDDCYRNVHIS